MHREWNLKDRIDKLESSLARVDSQPQQHMLLIANLTKALEDITTTTIENLRKEDAEIRDTLLSYRDMLSQVMKRTSLLEDAEWLNKVRECSIIYRHNDPAISRYQLVFRVFPFPL